MRDEFTIKPITCNGRTITKVIVDPHVRKHPDVTDDMILDLVRELDGGEFRPEDIKPPFEYFVTLEYPEKSSTEWSGCLSKMRSILG